MRLKRAIFCGNVQKTFPAVREWFVLPNDRVLWFHRLDTPGISLARLTYYDARVGPLRRFLRLY